MTPEAPKPLGDRIRLCLVPAPWDRQRSGEPMKTLGGRRDIVLDWGSSVTTIGACERGEDLRWRSRAFEHECQGLQHLFEPRALEQQAQQVGELRDRIRRAVNHSQARRSKERDKPAS